MPREKIAHDRPAQIVARRVREARQSRGWTQAELAKRLKEVGYPMTRETLTKLESGRTRDIKINDTFALALVLGVSPAHLLTPLEDLVPVFITEKLHLPAQLVRKWIAGDLWLPPLPVDPTQPSVDLTQVPEAKLTELIVETLERDVRDPLSLSLMREELTATARRIAKQIRNPKEEEHDGNR
jgi:transcriptional regulator with XRE-family HTH domain